MNFAKRLFPCMCSLAKVLANQMRQQENESLKLSKCKFYNRKDLSDDLIYSYL